MQSMRTIFTIRKTFEEAHKDGRCGEEKIGKLKCQKHMSEAITQRRTAQEASDGGQNSKKAHNMRSLLKSVQFQYGIFKIHVCFASIDPLKNHPRNDDMLKTFSASKTFHLNQCVGIMFN